MQRHYAVFCCLENSIRELIVDRLLELEDENWWDRGVPQSGRENCKKSRENLYLGVLTRTRTTPEASPLDCHSVSPALRVGRMDRSGRPQGDNDIVEQYKNPSKALPRAL